MNPADLLAALMRSSLEAGALLLVLWSVTRLWPRMPAAVRRWTWWLGSFRLLLGLLPIPRFAMSLRPDWDLAAAAATSRTTARIQELNDALPTTLAVTRDAVTSRGDLWALALVMLWAVGVLVSLSAMVWRIVRLRRRWREAEPFSDERTRRWRAEWAFALGGARTPEIRVCTETGAPLALGVRRPGILLPAGSERLSDDALRLVLAHELSHLRRRDPLLGWIPAMAEALFWFHPLARLASREYLSAREELCDADALRVTSASPRDYGELLLDFAVGRHSILPGSASCGTPAGRRLKRRLEMLSHHSSSSLPRRLGVAAFALGFLLIGFVPVKLSAVERGIRVRLHDLSKEMSYLLHIAGRTGTRGAMNVERDLEAARDLDRWNRTALYFRFGDQRWVTFDAQAIAETRKVLDEEDQVEARAQELDRRRDALDRQQERLESRWEELQSRKETLEDRKSELEEKRQDYGSEGKSTASIEAEMRRLARQLDALSGPLDQVAREKAAWSMSNKRSAAFDQQAEVEREAADRRTMAQMERIVRRAIARGVAQSYGSGGSSAEQPRSGGFRFLLPPATQIW